MAQEVTAVLPVERQQGGDLGHQPGHEAGPVPAPQAAAAEPRVGRHDVRGDQGVLEVEGHQLSFRCQDLSPEASRPALAAPSRRLHGHPTGPDHGREVHLRGIVVPVDYPGVEAEGPPVGVVQRVPQAEQIVEAVDGLALCVGAVQVDVALGPTDQLAPLLEAGPHLSLAAPDG